MTARGDRLAADLESRRAALEVTLAGLSDDEWGLVCPNEGWPLGFVAYHIGLGLARQAGWIQQRSGGAAPHEFSWDETHALNATYSRSHGLPARTDARRFLRLGFERLSDLARRLTDEQLDAITFTYDGKERSAEWVIRAVALRHIDEHHRSIKAGVAARD